VLTLAISGEALLGCCRTRSQPVSVDLIIILAEVRVGEGREDVLELGEGVEIEVIVLGRVA